MQRTVAPYRAAGLTGSQQRLLLLESGTGGVDRRGAAADMATHCLIRAVVCACICVCVVGPLGLAVKTNQPDHSTIAMIRTLVLYTRCRFALKGRRRREGGGQIGWGRGGVSGCRRIRSLTAKSKE